MQASRLGTVLLFQQSLNRFTSSTLNEQAKGSFQQDCSQQPYMLINAGASQDKERHRREEVRRHSMTGRFKSEKNGVKVSHGGLEVRGTEIKTKGKDEARKPPSNSERSISQDS